MKTKKSTVKTQKKPASPKSVKSSAPKRVNKSAEKNPVLTTGLKVGDRLPAFSVLSDEGEKVTHQDIRGKGAVIYFYPKDMTSGCTQESCDFRDLHIEFKKKGYLVFGVSKDSVESHQKFKTKYGFPFTLLSDPDCTMCEAFGVWKEKSMYGRKYMGIERTTFVISPEGKIQAIYPKVKVTGHVSAVLSELSE